MTTKPTSKTPSKSTVNRTKKSAPNSSLTEEKVCFVVSPIGKEGTEPYNKFKEVLEYIIKPAVDSSCLKLKVLRADDINHAGSFIKDILENILNSYVVIADLTDQNPNVFYELGVRHSISPRTVLIAQNMDSVPSDLREYRTIVYETSAKGSKLFQERLHQFLEDIKVDPHRPDNPVLCHLPEYREGRAQILEEEVARLKDELNAVLKGATQNLPTRSRNLSKTLNRILALKNAKLQQYSAAFQRGEGESKKSYQLPIEEGNFKSYFVFNSNDKNIDAFWYISACEKECDIEEELADLRVLIGLCSKVPNTNITFIIATTADLSERKAYINKSFTNMKKFIPKEQKDSYTLEIWDLTGLKGKEKELGIRAEI